MPPAPTMTSFSLLKYAIVVLLYILVIYVCLYGVYGCTPEGVCVVSRRKITNFRELWYMRRVIFLIHLSACALF